MRERGGCRARGVLALDCAGPWRRGPLLALAPAHGGEGRCCCRPAALPARRHELDLGAPCQNSCSQRASCCCSFTFCWLRLACCAALEACNYGVSALPSAQAGRVALLAALALVLAVGGHWRCNCTPPAFGAMRRAAEAPTAGGPVLAGCLHFALITACAA